MTVATPTVTNQPDMEYERCGDDFPIKKRDVGMTLMLIAFQFQIQNYGWKGRNNSGSE